MSRRQDRKWPAGHSAARLSRILVLLAVPDRAIRGAGFTRRVRSARLQSQRQAARQAAYDLDQLAKDVSGLADHFGAAKFLLAGHDWGGIVGWWLVQNYPGRMERFVSISAGHPAVWRERMESDPVQRQKSTYVKMFRIPWFPEFIVRRRNFEAIAGAITATARPGTVSDAELARYREAWSQPGAITGGLNWYRAILRRRFPNWKQIHSRYHPGGLEHDKDVYGDEKLARKASRSATRAKWCGWKTPHIGRFRTNRTR